MQTFLNLWHRWKTIILITLLTRIALFTFPLIFNQDLNSLFSRWVRWDGPHYINIAQNGYQTTGEPALFIVFYPLYPLFIKLFSFIFADFFVSAVMVSVFFCFIAAILLYELVLLDFSKKIALLSVWFLNIYPLSYFLQASYTESLFLATSLATLYFFRQHKFVTSTFSGILSTLTRINGLLLIPLMILEWRLARKDLVPIFLSSIGFIIYLSLNLFYFGNPLHFLDPLESNWYKKSEWPWVGVMNTFNALPQINEPNFYIFFSELVAMAFIAIISLYVLFRVRYSYGIYMLLNLLLITSTSFILSTPRYSLTLFPIYIAFATIKNKYLLITISIIFIPILFYLTWLYTKGDWAY